MLCHMAALILFYNQFTLMRTKLISHFWALLGATPLKFIPNSLSGVLRFEPGKVSQEALQGARAKVRQNHQNLSIFNFYVDFELFTRCCDLVHLIYAKKSFANLSTKSNMSLLERDNGFLKVHRQGFLMVPKSGQELIITMAKQIPKHHLTFARAPCRYLCSHLQLC